MSKIPFLIYYIDWAFSKLRLPLSLKQYYVVAQPIPPDRLLPPGRGKSIEVCKLDKADPCLKALPVAPDVLESRRQNGNIVCFGAFRQGRLIGCHWLALDAHDDEEVWVRFRGTGRTRFVWDFDLYVVPEERIGFAFARIWDDVFEYLRQAGIAWSLSYVSPINQRSQKSHERLGSVRIASFLRLGAGKMEFIASTVTPFVGIAVRPSKRVEIPLPVPDGDPAGPRNARHV